MHYEFDRAALQTSSFMSVAVIVGHLNKGQLNIELNDQVAQGTYSNLEAPANRLSFLIN